MGQEDVFKFLISNVKIFSNVMVVRQHRQEKFLSEKIYRQVIKTEIVGISHFKLFTINLIKNYAICVTLEVPTHVLSGKNL